MVDVGAVRGAVGERRDELVAPVRELVSYQNENPKPAWPHDPWGGELDRDRLWGRGACDIGDEPRLAGFEAVSDLAWLAEAGIPAVLYGPGDFAQAHSSAEYVGVDELVEVASVVALAVCDWCGVT